MAPGRIDLEGSRGQSYNEFGLIMNRAPRPTGRLGNNDIARETVVVWVGVRVGEEEKWVGQRVGKEERGDDGGPSGSLEVL